MVIGERKTMRKKYILVLSKILCSIISIVVIGGLCACGRKEEESSKEQAKVQVSYLLLKLPIQNLGIMPL